MFDPTDKSQDRIAEGAFVSAVAKALQIQDQILELQMQLQTVDQDAERANEAALRELGFDDATPASDIIDAQARFLNLAAAKSGLAEDAPVLKAAKRHIDQMRQGYEQALRDEANMLGRLNGPTL